MLPHITHITSIAWILIDKDKRIQKYCSHFSYLKIWLAKLRDFLT